MILVLLIWLYIFFLYKVLHDYELCAYLAPELEKSTIMAKEKFVLEYDMRNTPISMLWSYIATSNGLKEWFADNARQVGKNIILDWNGVEQELTIAGMRTDKYVRYHWKEDADRHYFEMRISQSEFTDATILNVSDWAEVDEIEEAKDLWNYQIETLQRLLGCA